MTDREKLIALLKGDLPYHSNEVAYWSDEHIGALADHLLANGVTFAKDINVPCWIPVTERLPENEGVVLVYGSRGGIYTAEFRMFGEYHHWHKLNSKYHNCAPTHWMPLPEPPKEGE